MSALPVHPIAEAISATLDKEASDRSSQYISKDINSAHPRASQDTQSKDKKQSPSRIYLHTRIRPEALLTIMIASRPPKTTNPTYKIKYAYTGLKGKKMKTVPPARPL